MDRNAAQAKYYFPLEYFLRFFDEMPEQSVFLLAEHQGKVIAATLYLADDTNVFSYLGGADFQYQSLRPTNLVIQRMIELGRERGMKRLILGGGYRPDDGIFRFKASFSPLRARFSVYRRVHLQEEYDRLVAEWSSQHGVAPPADFFPAYRAKPPVPEAVT
jgi:lipid II:glycine glycyltransferase (peptidoglycan interpeptide bridge formation enzyme)